MKKPEKRKALKKHDAKGKATVDNNKAFANGEPEKNAEPPVDEIEKETASEEKEGALNKSAEKAADERKNKKSDNKENAGKKHRKLKIFAFIVLLLILSAAGVVIYNIILNRDFTVTFYQVRSSKVSDNIRIVELADLHGKEYGQNNEKLIEKIKKLDPDLIFYAGDMITYPADDYSTLFDLSDKLSEIAPIYACFGNHELNQYLKIDKDFCDKLSQHHVKLLSNEAVDVEVGKSVIQLIAVSDNVDEFDVETNNAKKFLDSLEPTDNCRICLTHYPELFFKKLLNRGIDVAFTGHAHGGIIRLPKIGGLYSAAEGFFPKLTSGVVEMKDGTQVVISRGLGDSSPFPRINNQPELVVVDICWY